MEASMNFIIVEDHDQEAQALQEALADLGFRPQNQLALARSALAAREEITRHEASLAIVFLDLCLPSSPDASRIDNEVGYELLDWLHGDLNRKGHRNIRVVIVSGQYRLTGVVDHALHSGYEGTLIGVVHKENLRADLTEVLATLTRDPLLETLIRLRVDVISDYQTVVNPTFSANSRCLAAKRIACKLLTNDSDYRNRKVAAASYGDDLNRAIKEVVEGRFKPDQKQKRRVVKSNIESGDAWETFIWRGAMLEHLYGINNYRNRIEHLAEHDYVCAPPGRNEWNIPHEEIEYFSRGEDVTEIVTLQIKALLRWYLPWHEQVYLPWAQGKRTQTEGHKE